MTSSFRHHEVLSTATPAEPGGLRSEPVSAARGRELTRMAVAATLHCLTGCAIGEVLGMALATWWGWATVRPSPWRSCSRSASATG
ncbi:MAG: hypothetical protein QOE23_3585 [Pseudonocardiales bacterium]|jgi:hypothetical protein|nr:hypothetical protein [Pseudonocardiales bacterium]